MTDTDRLDAQVSRLGEDRQKMIHFMRGLGWHYKRLKAKKNASWEFTRPDTGGLWDCVRVSQGNLTWGWVMNVCQQYESDFADIVRSEFKDWRKKRVARLDHD